jgi:hypothetical protein
MKKKYSYLIFLLFFSFLITLIGNNGIAEDESSRNTTFSQAEDYAPIITIDCSQQKKQDIYGSIFDDNFTIGYKNISVNGEPDINFIQTDTPTNTTFRINTEIYFDGTEEVPLEESNKITVEARNLIPPTSPYYKFTENGLGPLVVVNFLFCDHQNCWGGGGGGGGKGSSISQTTETAPSIDFYFEEYINNPKNPEIFYFSEFADNVKYEARKQKSEYTIFLNNTQGYWTYVNLKGLLKDTEIKHIDPTTPTPTIFQFEIVIFGIVLSTTVLVVIRKRWKK